MRMDDKSSLEAGRFCDLGGTCPAAGFWGGHRLSLMPTTGQAEGDPGERQSWLTVVLQLGLKGHRVSSSVFQQGHC